MRQMLPAACRWRPAITPRRIFTYDRPCIQLAFPVPIRQCSSSSPSPSGHSDHRAIAAAQELFTSSVYSPGSPIFGPNGAHVLHKLFSFLRAQYKQYGFREVLTPNIYKKSLWEVSGHWQNYKDDMYEVTGHGAAPKKKKTAISESQGEDESYGLKPMNCPGHCLLFKSHKHSYRELPVRYADFSPLHRNEVSGSLSGLTRVRRFHQDDGHIFCRPQQIGSEIQLALKFIDSVLRTFQLEEKYRLVLSTRPETGYIGSLEQWDSAERQLRGALEESGRDWEVNEGDGAFYGPKIDLQIKDAQGKFHQLSTIQLDMNLPQRFGLEYIAPEGAEDYSAETHGRATPVLIHRAIFGSLERFFAFLIEQYDGRWPFWLSPYQSILLTVNQDESLLQAARKVVSQISGFQSITSQDSSSASATTLSPLDPTFIVDMDTSARSVSKKIREAHNTKYNMVFVLGPKDIADGSVSVDVSGQVKGKTEEEIKAFLEGTPCWDVSIKSPPGGRTTVQMKMKAEDIHSWLVGLEKKFL